MSVLVRVKDIWQEVKKIVGNHDDKFLYQRITDAVEILANKGDWDVLLGTLDIDTRLTGRIVTLPPEVETILACNMCGHPSVARDEFFQFHLNGPGTNGWGYWGGSEYGPEIRYEWMDLNDACTYQEMTRPDNLIAYCLEPGDVNCELWVHGYDEYENVIRTPLANGQWRDGAKIPVFQNVSALPPNAPVFSRITHIEKQVTEGPIRLATVGGVLLGVYQGNETVPAYRRIQLGRCVPWIRIRYRMRTWSVRSKYDLIPCNSNQAVLMMLRALKAYDSPGGLADGEAFESTAIRWMTEEQFSSNPPVAAPIQVLNSAPLLDQWNYME
jgi:hypothetical protein